MDAPVSVLRISSLRLSPGVCVALPPLMEDSAGDVGRVSVCLTGETQTLSSFALFFNGRCNGTLQLSVATFAHKTKCGDQDETPEATVHTEPHPPGSSGRFQVNMIWVVQ